MEKNQELYLLLCQRMRKEIKIKEQVILKLHHELEAAKKQIVEFNGKKIILKVVIKVKIM